MGDSASPQASKRVMRKPPCLRNGEGCQRPPSERREHRTFPPQWRIGQRDRGDVVRHRVLWGGTVARGTGAESIQLCLIDRVDDKTPIHQELHHRTVDHINRHRDGLRRGSGLLENPVGHLVQARTTVPEAAMSMPSALRVRHADLVRAGAQSTPTNH